MDDLNQSPAENPSSNESDGESLVLQNYAERAYLTYAMSVVKARALPQVQDGQKPVQRRVLYTMLQLGLTATSKHVKSARVVGDVLGKLHPHGDSSVYDAMVRVAQDFTLRYPLIDGQGNFGSRDGDGAAAMRYTEVRLTRIAMLLLSEIGRGTVDFIPNYDGQFSEPSLLPARLPFVLMNGAKGPAVGYRPEIPPHNLRETATAAVAVIKNPDITIAELLAIMPGPDFPGGGQIISSSSALFEAYSTGRGSIRMRARWRREEQARGQYRIIVSELPSGVSAASVLSEIEAASNPQIKTGKKELSQDQKNTKALMLGVLETAKDDSFKDEPVRLVLEPKSSKIDEHELMAALMVHTGLESSVPINLVMIGLDGAPNLKGLVAILKEWTTSRITVVERRTQFRLSEIFARLHILDGRLIVFVSIEAVIKVIRGSDEPKQELIEKFALSEIQAEDILDIRLRQLARLEGFRLEKEIDELRIEQAGLQRLLDDRNVLVGTVIAEIESDAKEYGDDRRTLIESAVPMVQSAPTALDEPITVIVSANGWVRARSGLNLDRAALSYKDGDREAHVIETRTTNSICFIDSLGRAYSIKASEAPTGRGDGTPLSALIEIQGGAKIVHAISGMPKDAFVFCSTEGYGFIAELDSLVAKKRAGKAFLTVADGESPMTPARVPADAAALAAAWVTCVSAGKDPRLLMFPLSELKLMSGGKGVVLMDLGDQSVLKSVFVSDGAAVTLTTEVKVEVMESEGLRKFKLHRARKGCQMPIKDPSMSVGVGK